MHYFQKFVNRFPFRCVLTNLKFLTFAIFIQKRWLQFEQWLALVRLLVKTIHLMRKCNQMNALIVSWKMLLMMMVMPLFKLLPSLLLHRNGVFFLPRNLFHWCPLMHIICTIVSWNEYQTKTEQSVFDLSPDKS